MIVISLLPPGDSALRNKLEANLAKFHLAATSEPGSQPDNAQKP